MKKINYLFFTICLLFLLFGNAMSSKAADFFDVSGPLNVRFHSRFVYPDGSAVPPADLTVESKINYVPHYTTVFMKYQARSSQILRYTKTIGPSGNGVYSDSYVTKSIPNVIVEPRNTMEGSRVSYNSLFLNTKDAVKKVVPIQSIGRLTFTTYYASGEILPTITQNYYAKGTFVKTTDAGRSGFKLENTMQEAKDQFADIEDVLFASSFVSTNASKGQPGTQTYTGFTFHDYDGLYPSAPITFRLDVPQIKETFINPEGYEIPASNLHSTFVQNNKYYATGDSYQFGNGKNGQATSLPSNYTENGKNYEYIG